MIGDQFGSRNRPRRSGVIVIMMVLVLCGMSIALLVLAGQTCVQLKSARNRSLDQMQCNELIALGERILMERNVSDSEVNHETIRTSLPYSVQATNSQLTQVGVIKLTKIGDSDSETVQRWRIDVSVGLNESASVMGSKIVDLGVKAK
jgi:hypothetical protein